MKQMCKILTLCVLGVATLASCSDDHGCAAESSIPVILDMDLGSSTDDLVTLDLLLRNHDRSNLKLKGIVCDRMGLQHARTADIFRTYYQHPEIPIGLEKAGVENPMLFIDYSPVLAQLSTASDTAMFRRSLDSYTGLPDGFELYRQVLAAAEDHSVVVISCGFVTSLSRLLTSGADALSPLSGEELVRRKVRALYIQGGLFDESYGSEPDFNFKQAASFSREFFGRWPQEVPVVFNPMETGQSVDYAPDSLLADISWTDAHPLKQVYMRCDCNTGQRMWDVMSLLCLMDGEEAFHLSGYGTVQLNDDFSTTFTPSEDGHQRYMGTFSDAESLRVLESIREKIRQRP